MRLNWFSSSVFYQLRVRANRFSVSSRQVGYICSKPAQLTALGLAAAASGLAGCAQQPPQRLAHSKEYFPSSVYGPASPRVVADGEPVPRGGGTYLVGKPYTIAGTTYYPSEKRYTAVGFASWYGDAFHGRRTANGEVYDRDSVSAAHPTMPLPSYARVTNLRNNYSMIVRVNDRGPYAHGRIMDVSRKTAEALDFHRHGTAKVKVEYISQASLAGSDDRKLLATLRYDGPASLESIGRAPTMVAEKAPFLQSASIETEQRKPREEIAAEREEPAQSPAHVQAVSAAPLPPGKPFVGPLPLPPSRPFDLGTNPGAGASSARQKHASAQ